MNLKVILLSLALTFHLGCGSSSDPDPLTQLPTIFGVGINFEDIPLQHEVQERLFVEYGLPVDSFEGGTKNVFHPEFYLPLGTTVSAVSAGRVRDVIELDGPTDMLIMVTPDDASQWTIGYEHVSNVMVSVGDSVSVGQVIAELSPEEGPFFQGFGKTALMIFVDSGGSGQNLSYCPFLLLDTSVRQTIYDQINTHIAAWEENIGRDIFNTEAWHSVGCYFEKLDP